MLPEILRILVRFVEIVNLSDRSFLRNVLLVGALRQIIDPLVNVRNGGGGGGGRFGCLNRVRVVIDISPRFCYFVSCVLVLLSVLIV